MMKLQRRTALLAALSLVSAGSAFAQSSMTFGSPTADPTTVYVVPAPVISEPVVVAPAVPAGSTRVWVDGMQEDIYYDETGRRFDVATQPSVTRLQYFDLRGPHWTTAAPVNGGATPAQVSQMTGKVDSSTSGVPISGSGAQPGNMGPANSKGQ